LFEPARGAIVIIAGWGSPRLAAVTTAANAAFKLDSRPETVGCYSRFSVAGISRISAGIHFGGAGIAFLVAYRKRFAGLWLQLLSRRRREIVGELNLIRGAKILAGRLRLR
jgi:hypothetical protein